MDIDIPLTYFLHIDNQFTKCFYGSEVNFILPYIKYISSILERDTVFLDPIKPHTYTFGIRKTLHGGQPRQIHGGFGNEKRKNGEKYSVSFFIQKIDFYICAEIFVR